MSWLLFYNFLCNHVQGSVSLWCFLEMIYTKCTLTFMYVSSWHFLCIVVILIEATWHIYASVNWVIIGSGNDLLPVQCQAITWTNVGPMGTNFCEVRNKILYNNFHRREWIWKCCLQNGSHFAQPPCVKWICRCCNFIVISLPQIICKTVIESMHKYQI